MSGTTRYSAIRDHRGGAPKEIDGGGASKEEDEAVEGKDHCVPEDLKGSALYHARTHMPLARRTPIQAKDHHRYHATHPAWSHIQCISHLPDEILQQFSNDLHCRMHGICRMGISCMHELRSFMHKSSLNLTADVSAS